MDLSGIKGNLEEMGIKVKQGSNEDIFTNPEDVKLPFLVGSRNWYSDMRWYLSDSTSVGDVMNLVYKSRRDINEGYLRCQCRVAKGNDETLRDWLIKNIDKVQEVDTEVSSFRLDTMGYYVRYDKQYCEYSLVITRPYELYYTLITKYGVDMDCADPLLHQSEFVGSEAIEILEMLKKLSMFIPFWNRGGMGVYLNVGDHTKVPSYGTNIKELYISSEEFRTGILNNYGDGNIFLINPHKWYYVMKDVKKNKIWVKSVVKRDQKQSSQKAV